MFLPCHCSGAEIGGWVVAALNKNDLVRFPRYFGEAFFLGGGGWRPSPKQNTLSPSQLKNSPGPHVAITHCEELKTLCFGVIIMFVLNFVEIR